MTPSTSSAEFFDATYARHPDPWGFATSSYEQHRYHLILDHVHPETHRRVFEPGCSIGVLTEMLGGRCHLVHATDLSAVAVDRARVRCRHLPGVRVGVGGLLPDHDHRYDLIVFSEVGYYLDPASLDATLRTLSTHVARRGRLLAAHWIGTSADHVQHGLDVHRSIRQILHDWRHVHHSEHLDPARDGFVLDVWDRHPR